MTTKPAPDSVYSNVSRPLRLFVVAGEHSGDALGAKLMAALAAAHDGAISFAGVGGELMEAQGLASLFPMSEIAVMGPVAIIKRLPPIVRRVYQTIDAALANPPDAVVIIDAPEFTHAIAKRIRRKRPEIPIVNYVSPTVWVWRPGRARAMRPYVDHLLALFPFEPAVHVQLGGPPCTYVGHPMAERMAAIRALDPTPLRERLGLDPSRQVLLVLPGSRRSEVGRLLEPFRLGAHLLGAGGKPPEIIIPVVSSVRDMVTASLPLWPGKPHLVEGDDDKWLAFRLADAALAASGTVTLELAVAGTPMVIAYKVEPWFGAVLRRMVKVGMAGLPNLIMDELIFPEFMQEACTPEAIAAAVGEVLGDTPMRRRQIAALSEFPSRLAVPGDSPSDAAAQIVLGYALPRWRG
jgi:lipid-A-disaccharide synthase